MTGALLVAEQVADNSQINPTLKIIQYDDHVKST